MTVAERDLVAAIESTLHFYPPFRGLVDDLGVPGVTGRVTKLSHPLANLVGMARLDERSADATIARVRDRYASERKAFAWITGPLSTPRDIERRLEAAGLHREEDGLSGMVLAALGAPIHGDPAVAVREVGPEEALRHNEMMARAFPLPPDVNELFLRLVFAPTKIRARCYLASLGDAPPIAWSYLVYVPDSPIVLLGGAATVPEARGHGAYTALTKRRLDDARADGRAAAIIQADRSTSAPICARLGFRELCSLEVFVWSPPA